MSVATRECGRRKRHRRLRKKVAGVPERPRVCLFRSHLHLYVQVVDDMAGRVLRGWSTKDQRLTRLTRGGTVAAAKELGALVAADLIQQGTGRLVFDRGGYRYHGRVAAFADALRAGGVQV